ncbi:MAG: anaerobic ribonucleoside-triphosphate reductase activating protein [Sphaerochaetaceae bacterium]|jgi:pyruvate formate lyase activating enzyme|nr:anaerobic ribonucleoside-triphosphate reductase activating protein [Sphaerochaetaceae bacterium]MDD4260297.1 anaerobic ribonucleoside-triphosphate reductase activating protein [Sphaerochaetaceae bacterium]MDD4842567.1 anaerobic ribonucleoside-triphosphate reductase activating protein [Sphaerochaetaceae bacterium]MDX9933955.1 anaerobic ribonucleoside-triphosphate reductase activating protein [Sphaerochaetaceae bacterium]
MTIAGIQKSSLIDYPGKISCVLFTQGCNYDCFYCHNRALIDRSVVHECGTVGKRPTVPYGPILKMEAITEFLIRRVGYLQAVVISGGEPTIHEDLQDLFSLIKSIGYVTKLDTNGSNPMMISELISRHLVDYIAVDVKAPWDLYRSICGVNADGESVHETLQLLTRSHIRWEARTTVCPSLTRQDVRTIATYIPTNIVWRWNEYRVPAQYRHEDADLIFTEPCWHAGESTDFCRKSRGTS